MQSSKSLSTPGLWNDKSGRPNDALGRGWGRGEGEGVPPPPFDRNIRLELTSKVADFLVGPPPPPPSPQGVPEEFILVSQRSRSWNRFWWQHLTDSEYIFRDENHQWIFLLWLSREEVWGGGRSRGTWHDNYALRCGRRRVEPKLRLKLNRLSLVYHCLIRSSSTTSFLRDRLYN